jgi:PadR family transcriptional regulator PadR
LEILSRADEILLLAVLRLKNEACGVAIVREVKRRTGKNVKLGALWVSLDILTKRGLVEKKMGNPTPKRGGRSKIYYTLNSDGLNALAQLHDFNRSLWKGIPGIIKTPQE